MNDSKRKIRYLFPVGAGLLFFVFTGMSGVVQNAFAAPFSNTTEIGKYLVIATGEGSQGNEFASFHMSDVEIGADQELVSNSDVGSPSQRVGSYTGGLDLTGDFVTKDGATVWDGVGNRFNDDDPDHPDDTVGIPDTLPGARPIYEGIDYSGNVALTGSLAKFESSNSDVNADIGIQVNRTPAGAFPNSSSNNSYFAPDGDPIDPLDPNYNPFNDIKQNLNTLNGISQFNPFSLISELEAARDFIVSLESETIFTSGFTDQNYKDSGSPVITDLDAIDTNGDGIAVIDINVGDNAFELNNSDWILQSTKDTFAIFRMQDGEQFTFSNSSILLGDGTNNSTNVIDELGAMFFMDAYKGTNELFNLNNVILGGVALWDLTDFNPNRSSLLNTADSVFNAPIGDATVINLQNAQGCSQFISHEVDMSNNRWNMCSGDAPAPVPEPSTILLLGSGLLGLGWYGRKRKK